MSLGGRPPKPQLSGSPSRGVRSPVRAWVPSTTRQPWWPSTSARWRSITGSASATVIRRRASADSVVTPASLIPHGTMRPNQDRSQSQFSAKPAWSRRAPPAPRSRRPCGPARRRGHLTAAGPPSHPRCRRRGSTRRCAGDPLGGHPEFGAGPDQRLLQGADVTDHVHRLAELDDWVADQLPGAVPGDLAAPVHLDHGRARVAQRPVGRAWSACPPCRRARARASGTRRRSRRRPGAGARPAAGPSLPGRGPRPRRSRRGHRAAHRSPCQRTTPCRRRLPKLPPGQVRARRRAHPPGPRESPGNL